MGLTERPPTQCADSDEKREVSYTRKLVFLFQQILQLLEIKDLEISKANIMRDILYT